MSGLFVPSVEHWQKREERRAPGRHRLAFSRQGSFRYSLAGGRPPFYPARIPDLLRRVAHGPDYGSLMNKNPVLLRMTSPLGEGFEIPYHDFGPKTANIQMALVGEIHGNELNGDLCALTLGILVGIDRRKEESGPVLGSPRRDRPLREYFGDASSSARVAL